LTGIAHKGLMAICRRKEKRKKEATHPQSALGERL